MVRAICRQCVWAVAVWCLFPVSLFASNEKLIVHEWGTFTALQNERGEQLGGINIDDEPVPKFVHNLNPHVLQSSYALREIFSKGAPQRHPFVTVRLETPVIYFYPPKSQRGPMQVDVDVSFRGGWLTEFYPYASAVAPGLKENSFEFGTITPQTVGRLSWRNLTIGTDRSGPQTEERVWTTPRQTEATPVATPEGEAEKYLFYRGVGNFNVPLSIAHNTDSGQLSIRGNFGDVLESGDQAKINGAWLVHIRSDGRTAFRRIEPFAATSDPGAALATLSSRFEDQDYKAVNIEKLRQQMHEALVAEGLFEDEAYAMLRTWERAYFQKHGLRVFFTVPRKWTDYQLPLQVSAPAKTERVMIGRIELVSSEQRALLERLAHTAISDGLWVKQIWDSPNARSFASGHSDFGDLGVQIPPDYQMYLALGRFRNALVLAEARERPTENLRKFIKTYQLKEFNVPSDGVASSQRAGKAASGGQ
ncbi:MAG: hypothetical protein WD894_16490 [Pirellulales bacterium]